MALRMDAHQLDKLLVDYSGSSPAVALAPLTSMYWSQPYSAYLAASREYQISGRPDCLWLFVL